MKYETVVGLEVHAELATATKAYCTCANEFGAEPNTLCCPGCLAMPGTLPVLNKKVVDCGIMVGLATSSDITAVGRQDRKQYFYPDLTKGYQITQSDTALCKNGHVEIDMAGEKKKIRLDRIQIEEDTGKLLHHTGSTLIDFNRCGVPLIEIVSEPDLRSGEEARVYLDTLKSILEYTGVCDCKMQEGSLRCDVNVSVRPEGQKEFGTRVEMKNVSSFRAAQRVVEYESKRQIDVLESGGTLTSETRGWDDEKGETFTMRNKEEAKDYRYFPEPNVPTIIVDEAWIEEVRAAMPELPSQRIERYTKQHNLSDYDAGQITNSKDLADFFDKCVAAGALPKQASNWILSDISRILNEKELPPSDIPFSSEDMVKFIAIIENGTISNTAGKKVVEAMFENQRDPLEIANSLGLIQISDESELIKAAIEVIDANPQSIADYKAGKDRALGFLVGQTMRATKGKGNPQMLNSIIRDELEKR